MTAFLVLSSLIIMLITYLLVPANMRISTHFGLVAKPNERRIHKSDIPEGGGLSFGIPIIIAQFVWAFTTSNHAQSKMFFELASIGILALIFGLIDDKKESRVRFKIFWQIGLGVIMYFVGYRVLYLTNPLGEHFILGWISFPVTILWYLVIINAMNLIDGLDGLACGIGVIVALVLLVVGIREQNLLVIALSSFLFSGTIVFLGFNFFPAKIFLGETGTQFIALNIAAITTAGTEQFKGITSMTLMIPIAALGIPLLDVFLAIFRRIRVGSIFSADKEHIHHTMLAYGLSQRVISIIVYIVTILFGLIAIGFSFTDKKVLFSLLMALLAVIVIAAYIFMRMEKNK